MPHKELLARFERGLDLKIAIDEAEAKSSPFSLQRSLGKLADPKIEENTLRKQARKRKVPLAELCADLQLARDLDLIGCHCINRAEKFLLSEAARMTPVEIHQLAQKKHAEIKAVLEKLMREVSQRTSTAPIDGSHEGTEVAASSQDNYFGIEEA